MKATKNRPTRSRAVYLEILKRDIAWLVEHDRFTGLEYVIMGTGFVNNLARSTSAWLGAAIVALATVIPLGDLRATVGEAAFERVINRPNGDRDHRESRAAAHKRWERANRAAQLARQGRVSQAVAS